MAHQHQKCQTVPKQVSPLDDDDYITESTRKKMLWFYSLRTDYGMGLNLLKKMQQKDAVNKLIVTKRSCHPGFAHLGSRRFEHAAEACFGATNDDSSD